MMMVKLSFFFCLFFQNQIPAVNTLKQHLGKLYGEKATND
jgi:hypothetical protein